MKLIKKIYDLPRKIKIPLGFMCIGVFNFLLYAIVSPYMSYIDSDNILHEPFFLIITGIYLVGTGLILLVFIGIFYLCKKLYGKIFLQK